MGKRKGLASFVGVVLLLLILPSVVFAIGLSGDNYVESLRGIKEFWVLIQLDPDIEKLGLIKDEVRRGVESSLRPAGITIQSGIESIRTPGSPILCVAVGLSPSNISNHYVYVVEVCVCQHVYLQRDSKSQINHVITWSASSFGMASKSGIDMSMHGTIQELIDKFLDAYLTANPKQGEIDKIRKEKEANEIERD